MKQTAKAPRFLNPLRIHLPITAVLSIAHRVTGIVLALTVPLLIYLLHLSLQGPEGYAHVAAVLSRPGSRLVTALLMWALAHHALAGTRFLLLDLHLGIARRAARITAWTVNLGGILIFLLAAVALL